MARLFEPPTGQQVFAETFTPRPSDIDANGHVNNVVYLDWAQQLATAHWLARQTPEDISRWAWICLRHEVDYRRSLLLGEVAQARTWVATAPEGPRFDRYVRIDGPAGLCNGVFSSVKRGGSTHAGTIAVPSLAISTRGVRRRPSQLTASTETSNEIQSQRGMDQRSRHLAGKAGVGIGAVMLRIVAMAAVERQ